jgi:hypothetical protein
VTRDETSQLNLRQFAVRLRAAQTRSKGSTSKLTVIRRSVIIISIEFIVGRNVTLPSCGISVRIALGLG